jgi:uncharacterized protein (TIGR03382 family)
MVKVKPEAQPGSQTTARLSAARNEWEGFQVAIRADGSPLSGVRATVSDLKGPAGSTISSSAIRLYREELINVTQASGTIGATGRWPDALVPDVDDVDNEKRSAFPFTVPAGETRAVWVDVLVPEKAVPGMYRGSVSIEADGFNATVPVELEVWGFTLPSTPSLKTAFLVFAGNVCLAHTGSSECSSDQERSELIARYERLALDHRITLPNIWVLRPSDGNWSMFDSIFGPLLDGTANTQLKGARMTSASFTWQRTVDNYRLFTSHFRDRGWFDRAFDYTADEPGWGDQWSDIAARRQIIDQADPGFPTLVTTNITNAQQNGALGDIDIIVPAINHMESVNAPYEGDQRPLYDCFLASGKKLWMYQSCMSQGCAFGDPPSGLQWPSYMIDVSGPRNRIMQWADFKEGVTGELYYETANAFGHDAWSNQFDFNGNGDGTLFYPGTPAKIGGSTQVPVASIRLKQIRDGIEDYEYLALASKLGDPGLARQMSQKVVPAAYEAGNDDPSAITSARETLANRILELGGGSSGSSSSSSESTDFGFDATPGASADSAGGCSASAGAPLPLLALAGIAGLVRRRRK